jgi:hypothetical protein
VREERHVHVLEQSGADEYALVPTSSSAVPGQILIVPGSFSRSMIFFTAMAAVMFSGTPELWPSRIASIVSRLAPAMHASERAHGR